MDKQLRVHKGIKQDRHKIEVFQEFYIEDADSY
jgi:hypothetical protein